MFEVVLLAAIEFNRVDDTEEKVSAEGKENNVIHCEDKKDKEKEATKEEHGTNELERNVEAAWTNKSKSTVGKEQACSRSWYKIFRFLGT